MYGRQQRPFYYNFFYLFIIVVVSIICKHQETFFCKTWKYCNQKLLKWYFFEEDTCKALVKNMYLVKGYGPYAPRNLSQSFLEKDWKGSELQTLGDAAKIGDN